MTADEIYRRYYCCDGAPSQPIFMTAAEWDDIAEFASLNRMAGWTNHVTSILFGRRVIVRELASAG